MLNKKIYTNFDKNQFKLLQSTIILNRQMLHVFYQVWIEKKCPAVNSKVQ